MIRPAGPPPNGQFYELYLLTETHTLMDICKWRRTRIVCFSRIVSILQMPFRDMFQRYAPHLHAPPLVTAQIVFLSAYHLTKREHHHHNHQHQQDRRRAVKPTPSNHRRLYNLSPTTFLSIPLPTFHHPIPADIPSLSPFPIQPPCIWWTVNSRPAPGRRIVLLCSERSAHSCTAPAGTSHGLTRPLPFKYRSCPPIFSSSSNYFRHSFITLKFVSSPTKTVLSFE